MQPEERCSWVRGALAVIAMSAALSFAPTAAQTTPPALWIVQELWAFKDGAPESPTALAQTADGYLWVGASDGLYRFDGTRFELFHASSGAPLQSTFVSALRATDDGLWVGYWFGGFSLLKNGRVRNFVDSTGTVTGIARDQQGVVWAGSQTPQGRSGLWRFDGTSWENVGEPWKFSGQPVAQLGFDREGNLWILTGRRGAEASKDLYVLRAGERAFRKAGGELFVQSFTWDADQRVVTGRDAHAPVRGSFIEWQGAPPHPILRSRSYQVLDRGNAVWVFSLDAGVLRHAGGDSLATVIDNAAPDNSEVYRIETVPGATLVDREGSLWMGGTVGIRRLSESPLVRQEVPAPPQSFFMVAPAENGAVWITAADGQGQSSTSRIRDGKVEFEQSLPGVSSFAYRAPDGTHWFAGEAGLWHLVDDRFSRIDLPAEWAALARFLVTMTHDGSGGYWVSISGVGLYRLRDGTWTSYRPAPHLSLAEARKICPGSGALVAFTDQANRIWLGCTKGQLAVIDGEKETTFGAKEGIQVGNVTAIFGRGPAIWIGGEFGLQQYDQGRFHTIQSLDLDALRGISGIVETREGDLWLNGLGGIVHIGRAEIAQAIKDPSHRVSSERFDRRSGLPGLPSQLRRMPTAIEGTDGRLWFSLSGGVVWLDPKRRFASLPAPPISIQSISADSERYDLDQPVRFPAGTSNVQIGYAAVSLLRPDSIRFRYRLQGVDNNWRDGGTLTSVSYRSLPPGDYRFEVDASDANGSWSRQVASTEFTILPAYYQTNWFRALVVAAVIALLWSLYQLRLRQVKRQFDMTLLAEKKLREKDDALETTRTELARVSRLTTLGELTTSIAHEVSQPLGAMVTSAGACARWLAANPPAMAEARSALDNIVADGKRAREVIARIRALTKRQAPRMDLLDLNREILGVLALTEQALRSHDIVLETRLDSTLPRVLGDRVQLQQVLLNLVLNAIEAMSAVNDRPRELTIVSAQGTGGVVVEVRDSGIGFDRDGAERVFDAFYTTKAEGLGIGLSISRSIVEAHDGRLWAAPNQPHGAVFAFSLPAAENG